MPILDILICSPLITFHFYEFLFFGKCLGRSNMPIYPQVLKSKYVHIKHAVFKKYKKKYNEYSFSFLDDVEYQLHCYPIFTNDIISSYIPFFYFLSIPNKFCYHNFLSFLMASWIKQNY